YRVVVGDDTTEHVRGCAGDVGHQLRRKPARAAFGKGDAPAAGLERASDGGRVDVAAATEVRQSDSSAEQRLGTFECGGGLSSRHVVSRDADVYAGECRQECNLERHDRRDEVRDLLRETGLTHTGG